MKSLPVLQYEFINNFLKNRSYIPSFLKNLKIFIADFRLDELIFENQDLMQ